MRIEIDIQFHDGIEYTLLREQEGGYYSIRNNFTGEEFPADEDRYLKIFPEAYEHMMAATERRASILAKEWARELKNNKREKPNESN